MRVPTDNFHGAWYINAQDFVAPLESGIQRAHQMINWGKNFQLEFHSPLNESSFPPFRKTASTHHSA